MNDPMKVMTQGLLKMMLIKWGIILTLNFIYRKIR